MPASTRGSQLSWLRRAEGAATTPTRPHPKDVPSQIAEAQRARDAKIAGGADIEAAEAEYRAVKAELLEMLPIKRKDKKRLDSAYI